MGSCYLCFSARCSGRSESHRARLQWDRQALVVCLRRPVGSDCWVGTFAPALWAASSACGTDSVLHRVLGSGWSLAVTGVRTNSPNPLPRLSPLLLDEHQMRIDRARGGRAHDRSMADWS